MMRCCGRISYFRILHLLSPKTETTKKSSCVSDALDSLPVDIRTTPVVCFVTNLRLSHHTKLRLLRRAPAVHLSCTKLPAFPVLNYPPHFVVEKAHSDRHFTK